MEILWTEFDSITERLNVLKNSSIASIQDGAVRVECDIDEDEYTTYQLYYNDENVGFLLARCSVALEMIYVANIEIDISYRRLGIASKVLKMLMQSLGLNIVIGYSLNSAVPFWNSLGADLNARVDESPGYMIPFKFSIISEVNSF